MRGSKKPEKSASEKLGIYIAPDARIKRRMNVKWPRVSALSSNSNNPSRSSCSRQEIRKKESIPADLDQSHLDRYAPRYSGPVSRPLKIQWPSYLPVPGFCTEASARVALAAHTRAQTRGRAHRWDGGSLEKGLKG